MAFGRIKALAFVAAVLALLLVAPVAADVQRVPTPPTTFTFGTISGRTYTHTYTVTAFDPATGAFTATGNVTGGYTEQVTGTLSCSGALTFTSVYNTGYRFQGAAQIGGDGGLTGTTSDHLGPGGSVRTFPMVNGAATGTDMNHGQFVSSSADKRAAAQSCYGKPVQAESNE